MLTASTVALCCHGQPAHSKGGANARHTDAVTIAELCLPSILVLLIMAISLD